MIVEYGNIKCDVKWNWPNQEIFDNWKDDFLKIEETKLFDIHLIGGFLEKLNNKRELTQDIDIILTNNNDIKIIEKVINEGTRLGLEKYNVFFDVLWFSKLPIYSEMNLGETETVLTYINSDKWIVDGVVKKQYKNAKKVSDNLWEIESTFPTFKQQKLLERGYIYSRPLKLNK
jgi:hypothetical protein